MDTDPGDLLHLLDWRRRIADLYREVREAADPEAAWRRWRAVRDELFSAHPQSPIPAPERPSFAGLSYFDYDPSARILARIEPAEPARVLIESSGDRPFELVRFGRAAFELDGRPLRLALLWLESYSGGLFVSFRDRTSGQTTYGAGRYVLDTAKGADLGAPGGALVLDFNFSYQPSCSYDPRWACPLAHPENRLDVAVRAGERLPEPADATERP